MKTGLLLSATTGLMLLSGAAAFAQTSPTGTILLKPGQTQSRSAVPTLAPSPDLGIVTMKPGETVYTANQNEFSSVQAGATLIAPKAGQPAG